MDLQATLGSEPNLGDADRVPAEADGRLGGGWRNHLARCAALPLATRACVSAMPTTEKGTAVDKRTL